MSVWQSCQVPLYNTNLGFLKREHIISWWETAKCGSFLLLLFSGCILLTSSSSAHSYSWAAPKTITYCVATLFMYERLYLAVYCCYSKILYKDQKPHFPIQISTHTLVKYRRFFQPLQFIGFNTILTESDWQKVIMSRAALMWKDEASILFGSTRLQPRNLRYNDKGMTTDCF